MFIRVILDIGSALASVAGDFVGIVQRSESVSLAFLGLSLVSLSGFVRKISSGKGGDTQA